MRKRAGLWLAAGVVACVAGWGLRERVETTQDTRTHGETPKGRVGVSHATVLLRMPREATTASPQPFHLNASMARTAVHDGELRVALPDGTTYPVRIERQFTDATGHWNVVGRARTNLGPQAMVLTFGGDAVFGVLPTPDGRAMRIATASGGVTIAPAGGLVPDSTTLSGPSPRGDAILPTKDRVAQPPAGGPATRVLPGSATASQPERYRPEARSAPAPAPAQAPVDTTPVQVDVLALYTPGQVALRGSVGAVETEIANLFAIANQAHLDSGSRVRLRAVSIQQADLSATQYNTDLLHQIAFGVDASSSPFEDLRNSVGADLVAVVRPYTSGDRTCGVAFLTTMAQRRTEAMSEFGFSVSNVDGTCGPLVFAHELGHNLGSTHDRDNSKVEGALSHASHVFSFGYRNPQFATVMAYPDGRPWVAYFSNPASIRCGTACGIAGHSDNVRSLNLMAPAIASFRGTPGTLSIPDVAVVEPRHAPTLVRVQVRLTGKAPVGGIRVHVAASGGTATQGVDYEFAEGDTLQIPAGWSANTFFIRVLPDAETEPDETLQLHLSTPDGTPIEDADAVVTLLSEARVVLSGHLWFRSGTPAPTEPIAMLVQGADGPGTSVTFALLPPEFRYSFEVPFGTQVTLEPTLPEPYVLWRQWIDEARQSREWLVSPDIGMRLSGTVRAAAGMALPADGVPVTLYEFRGYDRKIRTMFAMPPDYAWSAYVSRGNDATLAVSADAVQVPGNPAPFDEYVARFYDIVGDTRHDAVLSTLPSLWAFDDVRNHQILGGLPVFLSGTAPPGGVTFRCSLVDRTTKAGVDYTWTSAITTIPAGHRGAWYCGDLTIFRGTVPAGQSKFAELVIDQVTGAALTTPRAPIRVRGPYMRTGGPQQRTH